MKPWRRVVASAEILVWPELCPCCGGQPDSVCSIALNRPRSGRPNDRSDLWEVPYCSGCLGHLREADAADSALRRWTGGMLVLLVAGLCVLAVSGYHLLPPGESPEAPTVDRVPLNETNADTMVTTRRYAKMGLVAGGCLLVCYVFSIRVAYQRQAAAIIAAREHRRWAEEKRGPNCVGAARAVRYLDRQGSVRIFEFQDSEYAEQFARVNPGKIIT